VIACSSTNVLDGLCYDPVDSFLCNGLVSVLPVLVMLESSVCHCGDSTGDVAFLSCCLSNYSMNTPLKSEVMKAIIMRSQCRRLVVFQVSFGHTLAFSFWFAESACCVGVC